ncbi:MAG: two-component system, NtrC family, sensor kinase [Blastocatellia bacterium]|jgi:signal transduction histidine kinase|nr:two-component system, NtrC family, sensor kinase [Blastocatellia bacterium]
MSVQGQTFTASLPSAPDASTEDDRRILIVDDEEAVRSVFASCLGARYLCVTAGDAQEALVRLASQPFALVIADVQMPGLSGIELLRRITEHFPDTIVIVASGIDRTQRVLDAVRLGAFDYLIKPCDMGVLELSVERALERRALLRSARHYKQHLEQQNGELARRKAELERLQAQIVHSEKMASLGQLAAGVAHELNNPAGFIYGNMEILKNCVDSLELLLKFYDDAQLPPDVAERASVIKKEIDYLNTLADLRSIVADCYSGAERIRDVVQNLRLFSRLDEAELKKINIHEGLDSTLRLLSQYYGAGRVSLEREYGELPLVDCYAGQLNQVWMNLLVNAAHAMGGSEGRVRITTRLENQMAVVAISDTGSGIAPELLKKIFDPFFTTKKVGEGTGLGLSIAYGIIKRHGGSIRVQSRPGFGTIFTVAIPIDAARHPKRAEQNSNSGGGAAHGLS